MEGNRKTHSKPTSRKDETSSLAEVPTNQKPLFSALALVKQNEITAIVLSNSYHWESWERGGDYTWHHWRDGSILKETLAGQFIFTGCGCITFEGKSKVMPLVSWCVTSLLALLRVVRLSRPACKTPSEAIVPIKSIHFYSAFCTAGRS